MNELIWLVDSEWSRPESCSTCFINRCVVWTCCSRLLQQVATAWWSNMREQPCYNIREPGCSNIDVHACCNNREQRCSANNIVHACCNMREQHCRLNKLFTHVNLVATVLFSQQAGTTCAIFSCVVHWCLPPNHSLLHVRFKYIVYNWFRGNWGYGGQGVSCINVLLVLKYVNRIYVIMQ